MKNKAVLAIVAVLVALAAAVLWNHSQRRQGEPDATDTAPTHQAGPTEPHPELAAADPAVLDPAPRADRAGPGESLALVSGRPVGTLGLSLENEVRAAVGRALDWLAALQREDGSWSNPNFPALTGLAVQAFVGSSHPRADEIVARASAYIVSCVQADGGIYRKPDGRRGGGLSTYNTAVCMTALHATGNPEWTRHVLNARTFIAGSQLVGDDRYEGGFGYDRQTDRAYADLLNTYYAVIAMRETADAEEARPDGEARADIDWSKTVQFVERLQNPAEAGDEQAGGFIYKPGESAAGTVTNEAGVVHFRSYGNMTYAGLLALIYADVDREDVRVRSAFDWAARHWTLEENPGMGQDGLFFFYNVLTKSLSAMGADAIPRVADQSPINWREELARRLVATQIIEPETGRGFWKNDSGRYWENDPVLVTAYSLLALQML